MIVEVKIRETLERVLRVNADSEAEGITKIAMMYSEGKIPLTEDNLVGFEIKKLGAEP